MADTGTSGDRISELAEEFLAGHRQGLRPSVEGYAAAHPELADEIRRLFPALLMMEELRPASGDATGSFDATAVVVRGARLERLGDFRVLREVGRGGMGVVYEAEQESLGRRVALKVLATHALKDTAQVRRFEREARAAARLHHTNIVPVFGVGEQEGLHYYVMQFIQGLGLDEVIAEVKRLRAAAPASPPPVDPPPAPGAPPTAGGIARSLVTEHFATAPPPSESPAATETMPPDGAAAPGSALAATPDARSGDALETSGFASTAGGDYRYWRGVARVGLQVARALEYAHTQGVFHRDVKPSNLLLDVQGTAWVADFGLAKAVEGEDLTHTGDIVGTLRYMAPERFQGRCDARSDVYALGLTLYEMLALRPAFDRVQREALIRQVMEDEPPPLRKAAPAVPRDLATVVQHAISRDPAGRYPTAAAMAEDLGRFLDGRPVRVRRVGAVERLWKWARRHPAVAALAAGLVAAVVTGLTAVTWQWRAALAARDEAQWALRMANDAVDTSFTQVSEEHLLNEPGMQRLREKLLGLSLPYYKALAEREGHGPAPRVQLASAYLHWGAITGEIGSKEKAKELLRTAAGHFETLLGARPRDPAVRTGLGRSYLALAKEEVFTDQFEQGSRTARRAADVWAAVARDRPGDPVPPQMLGRSHDLAGVGLAHVLDYEAAKSEFRKAIAVLKAAADRFPGDPEARRRLARAVNNLGVTLRNQDDLPGAVRTHDEARRLMAALLAERPTSAVYRNDMGSTLLILGQARLTVGDLRQAEADLEEARHTFEALVRENPEMSEYRNKGGECELFLGQALAEQGRMAGARELLAHEVSTQRELLRRNQDLSGNRRDLAEAYSSLVKVEAETGHFDRAADAAKEALGILREDFRTRGIDPATDTIYCVTLTGSALLTTRTRQPLPEPVDRLRAVLGEWEAKSAVDPQAGANRAAVVAGYLALAEVATSYGAIPDAQQALESAEAALTPAARANPGQPRWRALRVRIETARGFALAAAGKISEAVKAADRAVALAGTLAREDPAYLYDLACSLALRARLDPAASEPPAAAVKALLGAAEAGFDNAYKIEHDERLAPLRGRDDFREVVRRVKSNAEAAAGKRERPAP